MDPAVIEEDREAVTAFFRAQPLHFDGTRRSVYLVAWLHDMERIFQLCHIPGRLQVQLAARCLYGSARLWWIETGERQVPHHTWPQFYAVVHGRFGPQISRRGLGAPDRDPEIYRDMRHTRYQLLSQAWHAYPGETMRHYGWRFREEMLPHIPQDLPDPEIEAQTLLRNGVPANIRRYVPFPSHDKSVIILTDDILQAEVVAQEAGGDGHAHQEPVPAPDEAGPSQPHHEVGPMEEDEPQYVVGPLEDEEDPQYEVGPLEDEEEEDPQYVVGPLEEEGDPQYEVGPLEEDLDPIMHEPLMPVQALAELLAQEDDELMHLEPPPQPPIPLIELSSDDEDEDGDDHGNDDDEMPEEIPDEEGDEDDNGNENNDAMQEEWQEENEDNAAEEEDPEEFPLEDDEDGEDEPMEIVPDAGDEDDDPDTDSDISALTIEVHF